MSPDQLLNSSVLKPVNLCVPPSPRLLSLSVSSPGENSSSLCAVPDSTQKWLEEQVGGGGRRGRSGSFTWDLLLTVTCLPWRGAGVEAV